MFCCHDGQPEATPEEKDRLISEAVAPLPGESLYVFYPSDGYVWAGGRRNDFERSPRGNERWTVTL